MKFKKSLYSLIFEQAFKGKSKSLVDAIKNRHPVTFYYSGPRKPKKDSVLPGTRIRAEIVALGLSKKGNTIVRAWVQPPSTSKKGFREHGWRTFIVDRMSSVRILNDETFDTKRPNYNPGEESKNGPMSVTYVTSDWTKTPEPKVEPTKPEPVKPEPTKPEPEVEPTKPEELPQPKPKEKPSAEPEIKDLSGDVYKKLSSTIKTTDGQKTITTQEYKNAKDELYKLKQKEWVELQKKLGKNISPGEGTRRRFDIEANNELTNLLKKDNINVIELDKQLSESISRIKTLMLI